MAKIRHLTPPGFKRLTLDGGRVAYSPNTAVRDVHTLFLKDAGPIEYHDPGLDIIGHTRRGHHYYFKTDLKSAFDYVTYERLHAVVDGLGIDLRLLEPRDHFFHEQGEGGLIQGAPASPYLFEIYCRFGGLDFELGQYCEAAGLHCTRYVDDVLLSSDKRCIPLI